MQRMAVQSRCKKIKCMRCQEAREDKETLFAYMVSTKILPFLAQRIPLPLGLPPGWPAPDLSLESTDYHCKEKLALTFLEEDFGVSSAGIYSPFLWEQPRRCPLGNFHQRVTPPGVPR